MFGTMGAAARVVTVTFTVIAALAVWTSAARAATSGAANLNFPATVTVGQTGVPASLEIVNLNTAPDGGVTNVVCNSDDQAQPCIGQGILLVPSCKEASAFECTAASVDPGVFGISSTGAGRLGTACAGMRFDITPANPTSGAMAIRPDTLGGRVTLPGNGSSCVVDFTFSVLKLPTGDADATPGIQTAQLTRVRQVDGAMTAGTVALDSGQMTVVAAPGAPPPAPAPPPPCTDCDGDGYPATVDCNDGDPALHPGAVDRPQNKRDEDCSGRDAPYPRLDSRVRYQVLFYGRSSVFNSLRVHSVRAGSTIRLACVGRDCPLKTSSRKVTRYTVEVHLTTLLRRTRLRPGTRLNIRITKPGTIGVERRLTIRTRRAPREVNRCLAPSTNKAITCRR